MTSRGWNRFGPADQAAQLRVTEGMLPIGDYADRNGYEPDFVGAATPLELPGVGRWADDLVQLLPEARTFGRSEHELRYRNFSVVMSASRGLPLFSAVNIDGSQSNRDVERTDVWRRDPRIPADAQNLREGYGNESGGFFSRGHMIRREDPNWGEDAVQADADTFHITNVAPQRQGFNAGLWLDLENYVLDSADEQNLRISVITGPVLTQDDPVYYNVAVPTEFWKIVVFVHGRSGALTTIAYRRSQVDALPSLSRSRFVFGDFDDTQVSVASIAEATGLELDDYAAHDVMAGADVRMAVRLRSVSDLFLTR